MPVPFSLNEIQRIDHDGHPLSHVEAGRGPILLLIHGSLCDLRYWRWQIPALSEHFRVVAPSLRGYWPHAFTQADPGFNVLQHARDISHLIETLSGNAPVHVLGHSRGAHVALELAAMAPKQIASLILADPGLRTPSATTAMDFQLEAVEKLASGHVEEALTGFIDTVNGPDTWRRMTSWFKTMVRDNAYTLLSQMAERDTRFDLTRARGIDCPVLLLGGEHSPSRYAKVMDALEAAIRQTERDLIPNAAHGMNLGNAPAFNRRVTQFVEGIGI